MLSKTRIKTEIEKTKEFAKKYQTPLACAASAVAAAAVTRKLDVSIMHVKDGVAQVMLYRAGRDNAGLLMYNGFYLAFLENKGLTAEAQEYIRAIATKAAE